MPSYDHTHELLRGVARDLGEEVFNGDPDDLRAVLDDMLDEDELGTADLELIVGAVRFGSLVRAQRQMDAGRSIPAAIEAVGVALSNRVESTDGLVGTTWAVAVLLYAVGALGEPQIKEYVAGRRTGTTVTWAPALLDDAARAPSEQPEQPEQPPASGPPAPRPDQARPAPPAELPEGSPQAHPAWAWGPGTAHQRQSPPTPQRLAPRAPLQGPPAGPAAGPAAGPPQGPGQGLGQGLGPQPRPVRPPEWADAARRAGEDQDFQREQRGLWVAAVGLGVLLVVLLVLIVMLVV